MSEPLQPFAPGTVTRCPTCGEEIHGFDQQNDLEPVYGAVSMWPGGPVVEATWEPPTYRIRDSTFTVHPCGHVMREGFTLTVRRAEVER